LVFPPASNSCSCYLPFTIQNQKSKHFLKMSAEEREQHRRDINAAKAAENEKKEEAREKSPLKLKEGEQKGKRERYKGKVGDEIW
jgi:hypothetical protein